MSEKIDFFIKLKIKHQSDENIIKDLDIDLTINQFYNLLNDFQKIETMVQTLV
jgi:hypothetical protein